MPQLSELRRKTFSNKFAFARNRGAYLIALRKARSNRQITTLEFKRSMGEIDRYARGQNILSLQRPEARAVLAVEEQRRANLELQQQQQITREPVPVREKAQELLFTPAGPEELFKPVFGDVEGRAAQRLFSQEYPPGTVTDKPVLRTERLYTPYQPPLSEGAILRRAIQYPRTGTGETVTITEQGDIYRGTINPLAENIRQGGTVAFMSGPGGRPVVSSFKPSPAAKPIFEFGISSAFPVSTSLQPKPMRKPVDVLALQSSFGLGLGGVFSRAAPSPANKIFGFDITPSLHKGFELKQRAAKQEIAQEPYKAYFTRGAGESLIFGTEYASAFKETISDPKTFIIVGGTLLLTKSPRTAKATQLFLSTALPVIVASDIGAIGRKEKTPGQVLGEYSAFGLAFKGTEKGLKLLPKAITTQAALLTGGLVGGKSARARSKFRKKLAKRSRSNIFLDTQQGEVGVRLRSKELKTQFTKERILRFDQPGRAAKSVTDVLQAGRGALKTNLRTFESGKGKPPTPGFRKLFPKGFGSQAVIRSGKLSLVGETLTVQRTGKFDAFKPPQQIAKRTAPVKRIRSGRLSLELEQPKAKGRKTRAARTELLTGQRGGFRPGFGEALIRRTRARALERVRLKDLGGLITAQLPGQAPKIITKQTPRLLTQPETDFKFNLVPFSDLTTLEEQRQSSFLGLGQAQAPAVTPIFDTKQISTPKSARITAQAIAPYPKPGPAPTLKTPKITARRQPLVISPIKAPPVSIPKAPPFRKKERQKDIITPPPDIGLKIRLPRIPKGKPGKSDYLRTPSLQKKVFTPSLTAEIFDIKLKGYKTKKLFTGFELRPKLF